MAKSQYERLIDILKTSVKKTVDTKEIQHWLKTKSYTGFHELISSAISKEAISPVKASGTNGRQPGLFNRYRIHHERIVDTEWIRRELLTLHPKLSIVYYQKDPKSYRIDREIVLVYNDFFQKGIIPDKIERRELSFLLFSEEKALESSTQGYKVLKRLGLNLESDFNCFDRRQPFTWFPFSSPIRKILIIENLTPFYDLFLILKSTEKEKPFDAIVFGSGRHINASFTFFYDLFAGISDLELFYWGDIDATGLNIYSSLKQQYPVFNLRLWQMGYGEMIRKNRLKKVCDNTRLNDYIAEGSEQPLFDTIKKIIESDRVIPQETLNYGDIEAMLWR